MAPLDPLTTPAAPLRATAPWRRGGLGRLATRVFIVAAVAAGLVMVASVTAFLAQRCTLGVSGMAAFMACFAVVKYAVAAKAVTAPLEADGSDPRALYGTPTRFWIYVAMKGIAATLALGCAIYMLLHGAAYLH